MLDGVTASLLAMGVGIGTEHVSKKFNLSNTLKSDFDKALNQALKKWSPNEAPRKKFKNKKYIFEELIKAGYSNEKTESLSLETKNLLIEFDKAVSEYQNLSNFIQQSILKQLIGMIENLTNANYTSESHINLAKYNNLTIELLEQGIPKEFYKREFIQQGSTLEDKKEIYDINTSLFLGKKNIIYGEGGLGKSVFLKNLGSLFLNEDLNFCAYFDAKKHTSNIIENIESNSEKLSYYLSTLGRCFNKELREFELDTFLLPKENKQYNNYIIVDGINEIPTSKERKKILNLLDIIYSKFSNITIVCSSRYKGGYNYNSWQIFKSLPVSIDELKRIISDFSTIDYSSLNDKNLTYLKIPFFLDKAIKGKDFIINSYSSFIEKHLMNNIDDKTKKELILEKLSLIAYNAYKEKNISNIPKSKIPEIIPIEHLIESNIIYSDDASDFFYFEHQLTVDLLTSYYLSKKPQLWHRDTFDIITFESSSSWEIMQMILEQVDSEENGSQFLLNLYNWNYYAVLWCLQHVEESQYNRIDAIAIILIVSEKLLDKFNHTKKTVKRYLKDLISKFEIKGIEKNTQIVNSDYLTFLKLNIDVYDSSDEYKFFFNEIINIQKLNFDIIANIIKEDNPVKSWGYSNMFKRCKLTKSNETQLKAYFINADKLVQWRIVHSLGTSNKKHTINFLLDKILSEEYPWVSYGAIRSVIEIYYYSSNNDVIIDKLCKGDFIHKILHNMNLSKELRNCMSYPPKDKKKKIIKCFKKVLKNNSSFFDEKISEKQKWENSFKKLL